MVYKLDGLQAGHEGCSVSGVLVQLQPHGAKGPFKSQGFAKQFKLLPGFPPATGFNGISKGKEKIFNFDKGLDKNQI